MPKRSVTNATSSGATSMTGGDTISNMEQTLYANGSIMNGSNVAGGVSQLLLSKKATTNKRNLIHNVVASSKQINNDKDLTIVVDTGENDEDDIFDDAQQRCENVHGAPRVHRDDDENESESESDSENDHANRRLKSRSMLATAVDDDTVIGDATAADSSSSSMFRSMSMSLTTRRFVDSFLHQSMGRPLQELSYEFFKRRLAHSSTILLYIRKLKDMWAANLKDTPNDALTQYLTVLYHWPGCDVLYDHGNCGTKTFNYHATNKSDLFVWSDTNRYLKHLSCTYRERLGLFVDPPVPVFDVPYCCKRSPSLPVSKQTYDIYDVSLSCMSMIMSALCDADTVCKQVLHRSILALEPVDHVGCGHAMTVRRCPNVATIIWDFSATEYLLKVFDTLDFLEKHCCITSMGYVDFIDKVFETVSIKKTGELGVLFNPAMLRTDEIYSITIGKTHIMYRPLSHDSSQSAAVSSSPQTENGLLYTKIGLVFSFLWRQPALMQAIERSMRHGESVERNPWLAVFDRLQGRITPDWIRHLRMEQSMYAQSGISHLVNSIAACSKLFSSFYHIRLHDADQSK